MFVSPFESGRASQVCERSSSVEHRSASPKVVGSTPTVRSSLGEEMYRFELNADLREVWLRLAGNFKAPLAQPAEQTIRTRPTGVQFLDGAPDLEEESE